MVLLRGIRMMGSKMVLTTEKRTKRKNTNRTKIRTIQPNQLDLALETTKTNIEARVKKRKRRKLKNKRIILWILLLRINRLKQTTAPHPKKTTNATYANLNITTPPMKNSSAHSFNKNILKI